MPTVVPNPTLFEEIKEYIGFDDADSELLRGFLPAAEPHLTRITAHFYDAILAHPSAHAAITGGAAQVERLKTTLVEWMRSGLAGPHDHAFYERRCRIGRKHVQIRLPQRFMFTAMNLIRIDFRDVVATSSDMSLSSAVPLLNALDRLFDLELAIMLATFAEDSEIRLRNAERLATIGQLAASIGHDLRNPLGVIESSLFILRKRVDDDSRAERHLTKISSQVDNCNHIVTDLLELARDRPPKAVDVPIEPLFATAREGIPIPEGITFHTSVPANLSVSADPGLLRQVLANLITNSIIAFEGAGGTIYLSAGERPDDKVSLEVADDGPGFADDTLDKVFEPLFTTRAKGTGLGLAMVKNVIDRHHGSVTAGNRDEGGAVVRLELRRGTEESP